LQINESFPFELNWPSAPFNTFYVYYYMLHLLHIHLHTFLFVLNRSLDCNVLWNVSFHVTILTLCFLPLLFLWLL